MDKDVSTADNYSARYFDGLRDVTGKTGKSQKNILMHKKCGNYILRG